MNKPISPTAINIYRRCPRKFYFYINDWPSLAPAFKEAIDFGTIIHKIIKRYYEIIPDSVTPSEVKIYVAKAYKEVFPESMSHLRQRAEQQLLNFVRFEQQRLKWHISPRPVAIEKEFVKGKVHGIVDALFRKGDELIVVDWKTSRGQARLTEDIIIQLNVYMWLTNANKAYALFLEYGDYTEVPKYLDVESLVNEILSDNIYSPRFGAHCSTCEYQLACYALSNKLSFEGLWFEEVI